MYCALWAVKRNNFGDIGISDCKSSDPSFSLAVLRAFALIEQVAPNRIGRARKYFRWIVNRSLVTGSGGAQYDHWASVCSIDFESSGNSERDMIFVALSIIHECAHARLLGLGIPYTGNNFLRVEKICIREEQAFVKVLKEKLPEFDDLIDCPIFDESSVTKYFHCSRINRFLKEVLPDLRIQI